MKGLTQKQQLILDFLTRYVEEHHYPPSIREISAAFGFKSLRGSTIHLDALEKKGFIQRGRTSRSIRILDPNGAGKPGPFVSLPILGTIAAGIPLLAEYRGRDAGPEEHARRREERVPPAGQGRQHD